MQQIILGSIIAFIITLLIIPVIIVIAKKKKLYDEPDDKRKFHKQPIPSLGGLGMFIGFILSILLTLNFATEAPEFQFYIAAFLLIFFLGIKDDIMMLSASKKFLGQLLVAGILIYKSNLVITNMNGLFGVYELNAFCSYSLTIFAIVVIINAFNLIDGVDGLAGGLGLISSLVFAIFFLINQNIPYAVLGFSFAGCLLAFLYYNFYPARIFMGDTGSLLVGLVNSILVIKFIQEGSTYTSYPVTAAPAVGFGILLLPLMDTLRVFTIRVVQGRSPFSPDRNHIHHLFLSRGFNHKSVTLICALTTILASIASFAFQGIGTSLLIVALIISFFAIVYVLTYQKSKYKLRAIKGEVKSLLTEDSVRLVPLFDKKAAVVEED
ncbi:MraY family glycosyltransferase [Segetibacter sp.]|jgi:UDP-GlcNAc:undecaprenyl-phosphate GlcNAc-1-phosphate transferase|uniref:MraY family glycosyltransferase n=1 Tax=Segetibacter sp. TaxID=2231182 RepID=UPI00260AFFDF|nr:MraY family glycosyltransferase [Segetibacter sp.]MCW3081337.1 undecaprenyl-phosphate N-acetylglucosaminyl 1-phosphate transferase [Segetibacter sp.]